MTTPLGILLLEDDDRDAELVQELLAAADFVCRVRRVQTRAEFLVALEDAGIDVVLADYKLPAFDGLSALALARDARPDLPFIFVSGTLGEEVAIEAVKNGATDYIVKSRLSRLVPSVRRALREAAERAERKKAEEALRRGELHLAEAQRLSHTGSFGWDLATGELFWSDEAFRIFALDPSTKPSIDVVLRRVHPDDLARVRHAIDQARSDRRGFDLEHRLLMPDGGVKTVHLRAHALDGKPDTSAASQFVGAVMDVTERSEAYAALQRSEARFRYLFDNMPVALVELRTRGRVRRGEIAAQLRSQGVTDFAAYLDQHPDYLQDALQGLTIESMNERAIRMFGVRDAGDLATISNAWIWRERPETFRRILESRFRGEPTHQEETKIRTLDGRAIDVIFTIWRPQEEDSDTGLILFGFIDVTESVRTREKLQALQAEFAHAARLSILGELAASIAHEVNQPLAALVANGEAGLRWLNRPEPNIAEASMAMRRLVAEATRAGNIIARIRGMAARQAPRQVVVSLHDVIEEAMLFLRHELQVKQVAVLLDLAPDLPPVLADRIQLQQVVVNLAINAVQAMTDAMTTNRVLAVETAWFDDDRLICTLEDSGPGIAEEHLNRLFETFFTTKESGLGLGLAISRTIIEGHGGNLRVDNGSVYGGARFSFILPAAAQEGARRASSAG